MEVTAKIPSTRLWKEIPPPAHLQQHGARCYKRGQTYVITQLADMEAPDGSGDVIPTWLVSVSTSGRTMPRDRTMRAVREAFGMQDAEEDNHMSGIARDLFMCVDPARRVECECKVDELTIVRADGYRYQVKA